MSTYILNINMRATSRKSKNKPGMCASEKKKECKYQLADTNSVAEDDQGNASKLAMITPPIQNVLYNIYIYIYIYIYIETEDLRGQTILKCRGFLLNICCQTGKWTNYSV